MNFMKPRIRVTDNSTVYRICRDAAFFALVQYAAVLRLRMTAFLKDVSTMTNDVSTVTNLYHENSNVI